MRGSKNLGVLVLVVAGIWLLYYINENRNYYNVIDTYAEFDILPEAGGECKFYANPFDPKILQYILPPHESITCHSLQDKKTTLINNTLIMVDPDLNCQYRYIEHNSGVDDFTPKYSAWEPLSPQGLNLTKDFIDVSCKNPFGLEGYRYQWATIIPKNVSIETQKPFEEETEDQLSVIMLGFDSLSRSNFIRQMPKSRKIMEDMGFVELEKHTKVADNTFPNWIAMLMGDHAIDYEFKPTINTFPGMNFDNWTDILWRAYGRQGYTTLFSEDEPKIAAFNFNHQTNGFIARPPADHYLRPWFLALTEHYLKSRSASFCYDDRPTHQLVFDYSNDFIQKYRGKRKFLWQWLVEVTHDYVNNAGILDEDFTNQLTKIEPYINKSIVMVFSDHGNRYGGLRQTVTGRLEARLPLLSVKVPDWFKIKHPELWENLEANNKVMTTHFDLHGTLRHILQGNFKALPPPKLRRGISLFAPIPSNRSCTEAEVPSQFCPCFKEYELPPSNGTTFAEMILDRIHKYFDEKDATAKCSHMILDSVKTVSLSIPPSKLSVDKKLPTLKTGLFHYRVQFAVKPPSEAVFEGVVVKNQFTGEMTVLNDIERNNKYGNTSHCVDDALLKKLCHCV